MSRRRAGQALAERRTSRRPGGQVPAQQRLSRRQRRRVLVAQRVSRRPGEQFPVADQVSRRPAGRMRAEQRVSQRMAVPTRAGTLLVLLAAGLALGLTGLLAPPVCLLALVLIVIASLVVPLRLPWLVDDSPERTGVAVLALAVLVLATALSRPAALTTGGLKGNLGLAANALALPTAVPIGLLAALAAGALVVVALELNDRHGVQSALVLGVAVLGLASVAAPGWRLLPVIALGWPAALFTLTRLVSAGDPAAIRLPVITGELGRRALLLRRLARWQLLPVLAAILTSCAVLAAAVLTGLAGAGVAAGWNATRTAGGSLPSRSTSEYLASDLDLSTRGPLGSEAFVQVPAGSPRLWRAGTMDRYTGRGWTATTQISAIPRLRLDGPGEVTVLLPTAIGVEQLRTDSVRSLQVGQAQVLAPGQLLSFRSSTVLGGRVLSTVGNRMVVYTGPAGLGGYAVRTRVLPMVDDPAEASRLRAAGSGLAKAGTGSGEGSRIGTGEPADEGTGEGSNPEWTALPASVPTRVRQLGIRLVSTAPSRLAAVQAVERELDRRMTYNLNSPVPPPGVDAVDDVLFTSHSGFCEQFASAEVVLLRSAGVPARLAVGFSAGEPAVNGLRTIRRSDAHAWVEVWFPGVGWASSDPTPAAPASSSWWHSRRAALRSWLGSPVTWVELLLAGLLCAAPWLLLSWRRRAQTAGSIDVRPAGPRLDPDLAVAFTRLTAELTARGEGRAPGETVAALARRMPPGPVRQALAVMEQALYAEQQPALAESQRAAAAIHGWLDTPELAVAGSGASSSSNLGR